MHLQSRAWRERYADEVLAELVSVQTSDGVRLDGALRTPTSSATTAGPDVVIFHHGVGGNFYGASFFDDLGSLMLESGCAVLRVNSRGHDQVVLGPRGNLGAQFEIVDECLHDWRAWLDFAERAGYGRVLVWGHSLGAVKTIYYLATEHDPRVVCAIASSPPRFSYAAYASSVEGDRFVSDLRRAQELLAAGQPEARIDARVPLARTFTARTYVDKYGPQSRYDMLALAPRTPVPLLITLGSLEADNLAFRDLAAAGPLLHEQSRRLRYAMIAGADHSYQGHVAELWTAARRWLGEETFASTMAGASQDHPGDVRSPSATPGPAR
jgi:pimeloyl-ACP methyl ester carboxylesterase